MAVSLDTIVFRGALAAITTAVPLILLYRRAAVLVYQEMVYAGRAPAEARPYLQAASLLPLAITIAWCISLLLGSPGEGLATASLPSALAFFSGHALAGILATRGYERRCIAEPARSRRPAADPQALEMRERETDALMEAHP